VIREIIEDKLAPKRDSQKIETTLKTEQFMAEIAKSRAETIKWAAGILIVQASVVATLIKLL